MKEMVNHPSHYAWLKEQCGIEPIDICQHFGFNIGCALKYLMRKGKTEMNMTEREQRIQDLLKAQFYLDYEILNLRRQQSDEINKPSVNIKDVIL